MPYSKKVVGGKSSLMKFCFQDDFEGVKPNGCQEFKLIVFIVREVPKRTLGTVLVRAPLLGIFNILFVLDLNRLNQRSVRKKRVLN